MPYKDKAFKREYDKKWKEAHPDRQRAYNREYMASNNHTFRVRRKGWQGDGTVTQQEWRDLKAYYGNRCAYCLSPVPRAHMDHMIPLSRNGKHALENVVPTCQSCNLKKHALTPLEWLLRQRDSVGSGGTV